ncbi:MAG: ribosomal RNA small subunit methyltransferase A [Deltaproteobacteria bacterium]|nr:ribosomal RNA small subunit methyltransferase A [Deltaproteobacteria bacterium]
MRCPIKSGIRPKKSLGQHFLSHQGIIRRIVETARIKAGDDVLEIGPGRGGLTKALIDAGASVIAIELDRDLCAGLRAKFSGNSGFELIEGDCLSISFSEIAERKKGRLKLVSNLPYNISSPVLFKLMDERQSFSLMALMLQKEVALRIASGPDSKDYGILSVLLQTFFHVKKEFDVPPGFFYPRPKVASSVVRLMPIEGPNISPEQEGFYRKTVKTAFGQRRKTLLNVLKKLCPDTDALNHALNHASIDPKRRAETLSIDEFIRLSSTLGRLC